MTTKRLAIGLVCLAVAFTTLTNDPVRGQDKVADLVGKPAPNFSTDFGINGKAVQLSDLKGKIVVLDFWAVWCGPCIKTFPHLREWHEKYKDKGVEVVGVTTYYKKIGFDVAKGRITRVKQDLSAKDEQGMLKSFAAHHKLGYRLVTIPPDKRQEVYKSYHIRGIPTVLVIDRKGIVRLAKVGSTEANAKAIDETIQELVK